MHFGTMSVRTAFRFPRIPWLPSSLRNPLPLQREKPSSRKTEGAVDSAGSADRRASSLGGDCDLIYAVLHSWQDPLLCNIPAFTIDLVRTHWIRLAIRGFEIAHFSLPRSVSLGRYVLPLQCRACDAGDRSPNSVRWGSRRDRLHREGLKVARRAPAPADFLPLLSTENP